MTAWQRTAAILAFVVAAASTAARAEADLYAALGGRAGITQLMQDFVPRLKADTRIGHFFKDSATKHLVQQLSDQVCELAGGPCTLDAPGMKEAHAEMAISAADFNRLVEVLQDSMDAQRLPFAAQNRLLARLAPMHREIVNTPAGAD